MAGKDLTLVYFGSTRAWSDMQPKDFLLRENCLLEGFANISEVCMLLVVKQVTRPNFFSKVVSRLKTKKQMTEKVKDVFVCNLLPERGAFKFLAAANRWLKRLQFRVQAGSLLPSQTVIWCFWPTAFQLASDTGMRGLRVFDADHNIIGDVNRRDRESLEKTVSACVQKSDLVVAGSRSMLTWASVNGAQNSGFLRNGVNLERFRGAKDEPTDLKNLPRPRIGYVGSLSNWVDYNLLSKLARSNPNWSFVIIGGRHMTESNEEFYGQSNVYFLGPRGADEVPGYLQHLEVGLGLYKQEYSSWLDGDSMKFYEFLAAGLPIVTTPFHPNLLKDFDNLIEVARDEVEFSKAITRLLVNNVSKGIEWNQRREKFLAANTWTCRAKEAIGFVQKTRLNQFHA